jgi:hypothetical protein
MYNAAPASENHEFGLLRLIERVDKQNDNTYIVLMY